ncbi:MAG: hydroxyacid dehydrogenase [Deltaproteobacteria bacterium]|jgi:D-3-phosphoglycerate dehydrogenase|nr:hydroxyacid dehydrogenase [Deltaproteobacteria bacterium]
MPHKVLISDKIEAPCLEAFDKAGIAYDVSVGLAPEALEGIIGGYDAQVVRSATKVTERILEKGRAGRLRCVARAGAGLDNIDVKAAERLGITVFNTPGLNSNAVAELTVCLCMVLARKLGRAITSIKAGLWEKKSLAGTEVMGKTLGLIGFGHIGSLVARKALGLGMGVLAHDPLVPADLIKEHGASPVDLEPLLSASDFVSLHLPVSGATKGLIGRDTLKRFKEGAYLINCARGGLVDEAALFEALSSGRLAGAAVDVFQSEPPGGSPLLALDNFVATPHIGASTLEAQDGVARKVAELVVGFLGGLA